MTKNYSVKSSVSKVAKSVMVATILLTGVTASGSILNSNSVTASTYSQVDVKTVKTSYSLKKDEGVKVSFKNNTSLVLDYKITVKRLDVKTNKFITLINNESAEGGLYKKEKSVSEFYFDYLVKNKTGVYKTTFDFYNGKKKIDTHTVTFAVTK